MSRPDRRTFFIATGALALLGLLTLFAQWLTPPRVLTALPQPSAALRDRLPNVVLISLDTLRKSELGVYNSAVPTTPHLDRRRHQFVRFHQAISQSPWTGPAHLALFYARLPPVAFWESDVVSLTAVVSMPAREMSSLALSSTSPSLPPTRIPLVMVMLSPST